MLLYLKDNDELFNTELIDSVVTAEMPDENLYPELYILVKQHMIHGTCVYQNLNSPCITRIYYSKIAAISILKFAILLSL